MRNLKTMLALGIGAGALALAASPSAGGRAPGAPPADTPPVPLVPSGPQMPGTPPPGYVTANSGPLVAHHNGQTNGQATCPAGTVPLGGGVSGANVTTLNTSQPIGTSWVGHVNNPTGSDTGFVVEAICATLPNHYHVKAASTIVPAFSQARLTVACPQLSLPLGGGATAASTSTLVNLNSSFPITTGWVADVDNASSAAVAASVFVVCGKEKGYIVTHGPTTTNPAGAVTRVMASCPSPTVPIGGGGLSSSFSTSVYMVVTALTTASGGGWVAYEHNASTAAAALSAYAICAGTP
jgi:hypothetical protein